MSHHPGLTDTRMALWLGSEVAAWDNANLSTLLVFDKKLLVSGKDILIRWWLESTMETIKGVRQVKHASFASPGPPSQVSLTPNQCSVQIWGSDEVPQATGVET